MDDESLGCGGLLAKYPDSSVVVTVTESGEQRLREHHEAMRILGVENTVNLGFKDGECAQNPSALVQAIDEQLSRWRPREVYLPFPSLHQDHIATYEAGMRACRISMSKEHWYVTAVLVYDIAVYDLNLYPTDLRWNVFEELNEEQVMKKKAACLAYVTETPAGAHPMNSVREMAASVGHVRLRSFAEQYALVRWVR